MAGIILACVVAVTTHAQSHASEKPQTDTSADLLGKPAPSFVVLTLDGRQVSLADYKGKALIVNFWATWCGNCKLEMPWLAQLREQYVSQGFEVVGIVTDGATEQKVRQIADKYGVKYPVLRCNHKTAQAYGGLPYLPESFYIDKTGKVVLEAADASSKEEVEANIRKLLGLGAK
ncbi:TlpA family protein disulfide reductase [Paracidobacterium acidisoli]|uniref:TlpA family protein disulfide reductase n=1 Tax=Paracidobacterium acidisoli TaxID=2303751 RepID=A0A372IN80_9BACT|nr:TlpA disulfide reductase family protein [Paracidobacterium acidisoli]MBT9331998.1 TlpA family protein disulfide reductase [Paracidobacterium acidisoli]